MDIKIKIDENFVEKMFDKHCEKTDCISCSCQVLPNEDYVGCYSKYVETILSIDIQDRFDKLMEIME